MTPVLLSSSISFSDSQFKRVADFIQKNVGIKMPAEKKIMVQSRLSNRLKALNYSNFEDYLNFVFSPTPEGQAEIPLMINQITTNLTNFFRENQHFEYMTDFVLPEFARKNIKKVELWSAGCSSGQEPYTLSIVMQEFIKKNPSAIKDYSILATDISSKVLGKAISAVYPLSEVESLSYELKKQYFLKSKDISNPQVRVKQKTREKVSFARLNFMDEYYSEIKKKHIIFCRNVLIYFDKETQKKVVKKLLNHLETGGYLFLGHSETIFGMDLPLKTVAPTTFQKL